MAASKRKWKNLLKTAGRVAAGTLRETVDNLAGWEDEWVYPEDALEDALFRLPVALLESIADEIKEERREPIPKAVRDAVLERDHHRCVVRGCKYKGTLDLHHYKPLSEGGTNGTGNLVALCPNHHRLVHAGRIKIRKPKRVPPKRGRKK